MSSTLFSYRVLLHFIGFYCILPFIHFITKLTASQAVRFTANPKSETKWNARIERLFTLLYGPSEFIWLIVKLLLNILTTLHPSIQFALHNSPFYVDHQYFHGYLLLLLLKTLFNFFNRKISRKRTANDCTVYSNNFVSNSIKQNSQILFYFYCYWSNLIVDTFFFDCFDLIYCFHRIFLIYNNNIMKCSLCLLLLLLLLISICRYGMFAGSGLLLTSQKPFPAWVVTSL